MISGFKSVGLILMLTVVYSCSKATSKPEYKYKKSVGDGTAAKIGSITITDKELYAGIESELFEAEMKIFDIKFNKLNAIILERIMKADPKSKGLTNDQYMEKHIASKIKISKEEINAFVAERKIPKEQLNPQIMEKIKNFLSIEKKRVAVQSWLGEKTSKSGIEVFFQKPERPTFDVKVGNAPSFGGENAKVTIIEFSDFQCPFCAKGATVLKDLKKKYGKKVKIAFKQYPLPFHSQAKKAAVAALCANEQSVDLFWKLHDNMFENQAALAPAKLKETAAKLGADSTKFNKCLDDNKFIAQVEKDIQEGKDIGVKSTPTFFVNGKLISGAQPLEIFSELIDKELK
jgi:protein-disulfide isomerase